MGAKLVGSHVTSCNASGMRGPIILDADSMLKKDLVPSVILIGLMTCRWEIWWAPWWGTRCWG